MANHSRPPRKIFVIAAGLIQSLRPRQWLKNLAIFANLTFSGHLFDLEKFTLVSLAFIVFCWLSGTAYLINDAYDAPKDRLHPFKSKRPIAKGVISPKCALIAAALIIVLVLPTSFIINPFFGFIATIFIFIQIAYTLWLKKYILIDVMTIATTFLLRIYAGAMVINGHITVWFTLAVTSLALFLAVGKRRSERTLLETEIAIKHRDTLLHYPESLLDALTIMFATSAWLSYTMFTFLEPTPSYSPTVLLLLGDILPRTLVASKLLMLTVPFVIYAIMRYLYIIYEKREGESPETVLLSDKPLLTSIILWGLVLILVIYILEFSITRD